MNAEQIAKLVETKILLPNAIQQIKSKIGLCTKDSPAIAVYQEELAATESRWESETPVREMRAKLDAKGWFKSDYQPGIWQNKKTKKKMDLVSLIRFLGLGE